MSAPSPRRRYRRTATYTGAINVALTRHQRKAIEADRRPLPRAPGRRHRSRNSAGLITGYIPMTPDDLTPPRVGSLTTPALLDKAHAKLGSAHDMGRKTLTAIIEAGDCLIAAKARVAHGG